MGDYIRDLRKKASHIPIVVPHSVVILFNEKNEILIEERSDDGYFDFPGGAVDLKETMEEAAFRELFEETGLIADELELFKIYSGDITHYIYYNGDEIYGVDAIYLCHKYHGELKPQHDEVKRLIFCQLNKMPDKMSKRNKECIKDLLNR